MRDALEAADRAVELDARLRVVGADLERALREAHQGGGREQAPLLARGLIGAARRLAVRQRDAFAAGERGAESPARERARSDIGDRPVRGWARPADQPPRLT